MRVKKKMGRFGKPLYRSSLKYDRARTKKESTKSKVRGFLDDLPPVEEVFPFFNFQPPKFDLFTHDSLHPSELDISSFLAPDSLEIPEDLLSFPTYSQDDWIWLGEDGLVPPTLEPIRGALPSNRKVDYDVPPLEPIFGASPTANPIAFDQLTVLKSFNFNSNDYFYEEIEKRDYYKKRVRFDDQESKHTKRKTEPDEYSMYESSRKKANNFREPALERSSLVSTQSHPSVVEHPFKIRDHFALKCERSKSSGVHTESMPLKELSKSTSIECIRFDTVADILAFASAMSKKESESTASDNNNDQVTTRSSSRSGQVKRPFSILEVKNNRESSSESPIADCDTRQEDRMMENLVITPKSSATSKNLGLGSEKTENYFFVSHPDSSNKGERKNDSTSGDLSKVKSEVIEQPRRSTRIQLRQCRGKQNNLKEPLWAETDEWWVK